MSNEMFICPNCGRWLDFHMEYWFGCAKIFYTCQCRYSSLESNTGMIYSDRTIEKRNFSKLEEQDEKKFRETKKSLSFFDRLQIQGNGAIKYACNGYVRFVSIFLQFLVNFLVKCGRYSDTVFQFPIIWHGYPPINLSCLIKFISKTY